MISAASPAGARHLLLTNVTSFNKVTLMDMTIPCVRDAIASAPGWVCRRKPDPVDTYCDTAGLAADADPVDKRHPMGLKAQPDIGLLVELDGR